MDYLVVGPNNAPHLHARFMLGKLLDGNKGRMMLLFHGPRGAGKVLSTLHTASAQLQRKYRCTLLVQIGPAEQDPYKLKAIARLWPYAGAVQRTPAAPGSPGSPADLSTPGSSSTSSPSPSSATAAAAPNKKGAMWLRKGLQGPLPDPAQYPASVRRLKPFALPVSVARFCSFRASRTTDPKVLAGHIATSISQKGRCRVLTAGGLAALHALQAIRFADVVLARAWEQGLVMHVELVTETEDAWGQQQEMGMQQLQQPASSDGASERVAAAVVGGEEGSGDDGEAAAFDAADSSSEDDGQEGWDASGMMAEEEEEGLLSGADVPSSVAAAGAGGSSGAKQRVSYYSLTLIAARRDLDATPNTCVFPVKGRQGEVSAQQGGGSGSGGA